MYVPIVTESPLETICVRGCIVNAGGKTPAIESAITSIGLSNFISYVLQEKKIIVLRNPIEINSSLIIF
jgi:hypothetical protein